MWCGVSRLGCALMLNSGIVLAVCWRRIDRTGPLEWLFSILVLTEINVEMCVVTFQRERGLMGYSSAKRVSVMCE